MIKDLMIELNLPRQYCREELYSCFGCDIFRTRFETLVSLIERLTASVIDIEEVYVFECDDDIYDIAIKDKDFDKKRQMITSPVIDSYTALKCTYGEHHHFIRAYDDELQLAREIDKFLSWIYGDPVETMLPNEIMNRVFLDFSVEDTICLCPKGIGLFFNWFNDDKAQVLQDFLSFVKNGYDGKVNLDIETTSGGYRVNDFSITVNKTTFKLNTIGVIFSNDSMLCMKSRERDFIWRNINQTVRPLDLDINCISQFLESNFWFQINEVVGIYYEDYPRYIPVNPNNRRYIRIGSGDKYCYVSTGLYDGCVIEMATGRVLSFKEIEMLDKLKVLG